MSGPTVPPGQPELPAASADATSAAPPPTGVSPPASTGSAAGAGTGRRPLADGRASGRGRGWLREVLALFAFVVAVGMARATIADHYYVPTGSMIPTVEVGDRVVVSKLAYGLRLPFSDNLLLPWSAPVKGDVVVLSSPEGGTTLLKRVVAVPGDMVEVYEGQLWINGAPVPVLRDDLGLHEALGRGGWHPLRLTRGGGLDFGPVEVGPGEYLVMGDNRGESHDGRAFGLVKREAIFGRALSVWMRQGELCWYRL